MLKVARHPDPHGYGGRPAKELSWVGESPAAHRDGPWGQLPVTGVVSAFLVDSNPLARAGLRDLLFGSPFEVMALAGTFDEISHMAVLKDRPALLLIDGAADHEATLRDAQAFKKTHPGGRIVVFVEDYALDRVFAAYEAGVDGYLWKSIPRDSLLKSLELVMLGERFFPSDVLGLMRSSVQAAASRPDQASEAEPAKEPWDGVDRRDPKGLSMREIIILRCLMDGDSNKVIARKCDIAEATVKVHVKAILRKIKAKNRTQAALWATAHLPRIERRAGWKTSLSE